MTNAKVAYVATVYSHLAVFHIPFIQRLKSQGHQVHAYGGRDHCKEDLQQASIECRDITFSRNPLALQNIMALISLTKWFKQEQYDLIHVHTPNASVICRIAAKLAGCKNVIYTAHGFHFFKGASWINWLVYFPVEWLMSFWTDVIITINQEDYERARKFPVRKKAVYIPGVGVDIQTYQNANERVVDDLRDEIGIKKNEFIILCIAEMNHNKNQEQLIYSVYELNKQGVPAICLLVGTGAKEAYLQSLVKRLHLEHSVRFLGFRKDIPAIMKMADTVALLSRREGLPKVLLEASAAGKPMVVTDVRGSRELVSSQINGFVVPVGGDRETIQAFKLLYANKELRMEMGFNSYVQASQYDLKEIMVLLDEVYSTSNKLQATASSSEINGEGMVI
ncbi:glycosyltransferase family 4 protein [Paenibacillus qinlingensis]|uniref:Glycosyltransferase involved in cell wall biosynthesis n=1 Tax=Paenibacillus qinlingensis TaxID=1837343 RepID=A0ABU1P2S4_9BACL|nr:glycosyltransferase family 4 protein [Paenibacillus qinlingensis]MDR6553874.1 glycosyltransferase involved in cell wall biosynthesis [Paenibacillus qinlingensis]